MRRREFITVLGGATAMWPFAVRAQAERVRRIGVLHGAPSDISGMQARIAAFQEGLKQLGWTDGRNVRIDYRWGAGDADDNRKQPWRLPLLQCPRPADRYTGGAIYGPLARIQRRC